MTTETQAETAPTEENSDDKPQTKKTAKHDAGLADLEKVTDFAEEAEITTENITEMMSLVGSQLSKEAQAKSQREKELAKVSIKKEDVELIMQEMEIPRSKAERSLREAHGNPVEALINLTN